MYTRPRMGGINRLNVESLKSRYQVILLWTSLIRDCWPRKSNFCVYGTILKDTLTNNNTDFKWEAFVLLKWTCFGAKYENVGRDIPTNMSPISPICNNVETVRLLLNVEQLINHYRYAPDSRIGIFVTFNIICNIFCGITDWQKYNSRFSNYCFKLFGD